MALFRTLIWLAKPIYWLSGFVFFAGVVLFFFSTSSNWWIAVAIGAGMWAVGKLLAFFAVWHFFRLPEDIQDEIDPMREIRGW